FETKETEELLKLEGARYNYLTLIMRPVTYESDISGLEVEINDIVKILEEAVRASIQNEPPASFDSLLRKFPHATTIYKHQGFAEEREVRIVACPTTPERHKKFLEADPNDAKMHEPLKQFHYPDDRRDPYIALFDFPKPAVLPIRRIIVGPNADQKTKIRELRKWLDDVPNYRRLEVYPSQTPFHPRSA
ncbi:MAG: hypothetical protein ACKVSF_00020, partial [Alphaproteobacteria bacterium]